VWVRQPSSSGKRVQVVPK